MSKSKIEPTMVPVPTQQNEDLVAPNAEPEKKPKIRKRVLGDGDGDYMIYEVIGEGMAAPRGSLVPIPGVPQFPDSIRAMKWLRQNSGDKLAGKQVMIFRACEIMTLRIDVSPRITFEAKPKVAPKKVETSNG